MHCAEVLSTSRVNEVNHEVVASFQIDCVGVPVCMTSFRVTVYAMPDAVSYFVICTPKWISPCCSVCKFLLATAVCLSVLFATVWLCLALVYCR